MGWGREAGGKKEAGRKVEMIELEKWVKKVRRETRKEKGCQKKVKGSSVDRDGGMGRGTKGDERKRGKFRRFSHLMLPLLHFRSQNEEFGKSRLNYSSCL